MKTKEDILKILYANLYEWCEKELKKKIENKCNESKQTSNISEISNIR